MLAKSSSRHWPSIHRNRVRFGQLPKFAVGTEISPRPLSRVQVAARCVLLIGLSHVRFAAMFAWQIWAVCWVECVCAVLVRLRAATAQPDSLRHLQCWFAIAVFLFKLCCRHLRVRSVAALPDLQQRPLFAQLRIASMPKLLCRLRAGAVKPNQLLRCSGGRYSSSSGATVCLPCSAALQHEATAQLLALHVSPVLGSRALGNRFVRRAVWANLERAACVRTVPSQHTQRVLGRSLAHPVFPDGSNLMLRLGKPRVISAAAERLHTRMEPCASSTLVFDWPRFILFCSDALQAQLLENQAVSLALRALLEAISLWLVAPLASPVRLARTPRTPALYDVTLAALSNTLPSRGRKCVCSAHLAS